MFPIAQKQFQSMAAMRKVQPKMKAIQERFKDDKQRQQQEILKLYQAEKINPAAGCLPILLQIPVFYALYKVLLVSVEMRHQPFVAVDQGPVGARSADAGQPVRPAPLHAAGVPRDRRAADPGRRDAVAVDEAQPAADGPGPGADLRDHAVGPGVRHGAVRGGPAALLDDQQRADDRAAMVAVPQVRAAPVATRTRSTHERRTRTHELAERARKLFAGPIEFLKSAPELKFLPDPDVPEIAFAGRSNVGKSSLLNALTNRKGLARTSNTPGRTQELNFFDVGEPLQIRLVDMPGYGFAEAPKDMVKRWRFLVNDYLRGRAVLKRALVLVDSRHGLKDVDREMMHMLDDAAVSYHLVLTKADKVKPTGARRDSTKRRWSRRAKHPAAHPAIFTTSSETGSGIAELRTAILEAATS